jgi:D-alanyl-D-alanine carboxypeptidase
MTTRHARVVSRSGDITATARYTSTVRPLWDRRYKILGGKTGHTEGAGYCLLIAAEAAGRPAVMTLLGGRTKDARFDDFAALMARLAARTWAPEPLRRGDRPRPLILGDPKLVVAKNIFYLR